MFDAAIGITFFLVIILYLAALVSYSTRLRKYSDEYWSIIGRPSLWDPNGQMIILKSVFFSEQLPKSIAPAFRSRILAIRALAAIGVILFAIVIFMICSGSFDGG